MDEDYLATLSLYQRAVGPTIEFHLTWPRHARFAVEQGERGVTLVAPDGTRRVHRIGELDRDEVIADVRRFILVHANVRGLKRGKHSTWRGAEWCKLRD